MTTSQLIVSRRFGVAQKTKVRAIDDFSASNINACTGTKEKVRVESVDAAATMIRTWMKAFEGTGRALVGRTYDLKSAYRQLGISAEHLHAAWISVFDPSGQGAKLFSPQCLAFWGVSVCLQLFVNKGARKDGHLGRASPKSCLGLYTESFFKLVSKME